MRLLTALSGPVWPIGPLLRDRLRRARAFVRVDVLDPGSAAARTRFGTPPPTAPGGALVVVSDDRRVWHGDSAWLMLLWALVPTRAWANRLAALGRPGDARRLLDAWGHSHRPRVAALLDPGRKAPGGTTAGGPPTPTPVPETRRARSARRVREPHGIASVVAVLALVAMAVVVASRHPPALPWILVPGIVALLAGPRALRLTTFWTALVVAMPLVAGPALWGLLYVVAPMIVLGVLCVRAFED